MVAAVDGVRQAGAAAPATIADVWHWGSVTKSMTATLAALLVEAGVFAWETTVGDLLGDAVPGMRDAYREANLLHLLSHRSGLQANIAIPDLLAFPREEADARASRIAYAAQALAQEPVGAVAAQMLYSNSGYVIVGAMMEQRLGATWEALIAERLFAPLGLASAGFGAPGTPGALDAPAGHALDPADAAGGRVAFPPGVAITDNPFVLGPAGRVHMSIPDMLVYLAAHRDGADLLTPASWQTLHTPPFGGDYALGLIVRPDGTLWHSGSNTLWYAEVLIDAAKGVVAAAAANDGAVQQSAPAVGSALLSAAAAAVL
jgi:CubicO group peptidase (beta-lactamase class C family)